MKTIVPGILFALLLVSVLAGTFNAQTAKANVSPPGAAAPAADPDWWPMLHHDLTHTGTSTSPGPTTNNTLWNYTATNWVYSSPAVVGGLVYVGSDNGNVYCLNAATGTYVWCYPTGGPVWSSPAVADGRVYVGSLDNNVYCLNAVNGSPVWSYPTGWGVDSSPAVFGGLVYVGSDDNRTYCLDAVTGTQVWNYTTGGEVSSSPAVVGSFVLRHVGFGFVGFVYVGSFDGNVYCLNATTGKLFWRHKTGGSVESPPAVVGGLVYVGSDDNNVYCLNAVTGALAWNYTTGSWVRSSPAVVSGVVYVGSRDGNIYAFGPPPLTVSISPASVTMDAGQSQLFKSSVSGGTSPYTYQWYLNGTAFPGAVGSSWNFTPTSAGSYTVYLNVTDSVEVLATSNTAAVTASPITPEFPPYLVLPLFMLATLLATFVLKRKRHVRTQ